MDNRNGNPLTHKSYYNYCYFYDETNLKVGGNTIKTRMTTKHILILIMAFTIFGKTFGQKMESIDYNKNSDELNELSFLIDQSFPFVEDLLKKYGEYYPFSFALNEDNTVAVIGRHDGDENPDSLVVIKGLKEILKLETKKNKIKGIAIFYDVKTTDPKTNQKTDAVAVFVEHKDGQGAYTFYYPYKLTDKKELTFGDSFGGAATREIFTK
jgi:hypothetical protein